jgi:site-specific DNA-methyltransferase (adenine-specific)
MTRMQAKPTKKPGKKTPSAKAAQAAKAKAPVAGTGALEPTHALSNPDTRAYVGDCRELLPRIPEVRDAQVDLVFADPPFNWNRAYDEWDDKIPREDYLQFTYDWIGQCVGALKPTGSLFINIPDDTCAEIVCYLKGHLERKPPHAMHMVNWCIWHYRFGQNRTGAFINSKVHCLYFCRDLKKRTWRPGRVLEVSDRRSIYGDARTESKSDGMPPGMRVPMDVWYGPYWGRIQGNNKERRANHDNQLPETYLERVIQCASDEGDLVLDPFLGSGTTGVVARALKRRFIGTEFSAANAASAFERIKKGPVRPLGQMIPTSTAIYPQRVKPKVGASTPASTDE